MTQRGASEYIIFVSFPLKREFQKFEVGLLFGILVNVLISYRILFNFILFNFILFNFIFFFLVCLVLLRNLVRYPDIQ